MERKSRIRWHREWQVDMNNNIGTESIRKEILLPEDVLDKINIEKNQCVKHVLEAIELAFGKDDSGPWSSVRRVVLRSINDYHRLVVKVLQETLNKEDEIDGGD